jgi:putative pyoverdin transport system ATP-binding/permease protein
MLKFLFFTRDKELNIKSVYVAMMATVAGLSFFAMTVIILESAIEVLSGRVPLTYLAGFFIAFFIFLITKYLSLRLGNDLIERYMEEERNRLANLIRHSELHLIERIEKGDIYTKMTMDIKRVSLIFRSGINVIQAVVVFLSIWVYFLIISVKAGLLFLSGVLIYIFIHKSLTPVFRPRNVQKTVFLICNIFNHLILLI